MPFPYILIQKTGLEHDVINYFPIPLTLCLFFFVILSWQWANMENLMVASIGQFGGFQPLSARGSAELTNDQSNSLKELLAEYDAENLTTSDAKDIVTQIQELGIRPGASLAEGLKDAGFDPEGLRQQAGIEGPRGPNGSGGPSQGLSQESVAALETLQSILSEYEGETLDDTDWQSIMEQLEEAGVDTSRPIVDFRA